MEPKKCPKCKDGVMKLPLATKTLRQDYAAQGGAKLVCGKCGYQANPSKLR